MSGMDEFKATFFQECAELMDALESGLMAINDGEPAADHVGAIFRAVHSVKGGAGAFNFTKLVSFAHVFETVLDNIRNNKLEATPEIVDTMLRAGDILANFVEMARDDKPTPDGFGADVLAELNAIASGEGGAQPEEEGPVVEDFDDIDFTPVTADQLAGNLEEKERRFEIVFRPHPNLYRSANEPQILLRELRALGEVDIDADLGTLPDLSQIEVDGGYITWKIALATKRPKADVEEIFEFVAGDCDLTIVEVGGEEPPAAPAPAPTPVPPTPSAPTPPAAPPPGGPTAAAKEAPKAAVQENAAKGDAAPAKQAPTAPAKSDAAAAKEGAAAPTIRVDLDRIDRVVDTVGELVITEAMLTQTLHDLPPDGNYSAIWRSLEQLSMVTRDLQESVMAMRAQPVKAVFQRLPRMVREVATKTGKKVRLVMLGENTEVDKTVTERLSDPLTHMIRNAVDHGLETPEERAAANKPVEGTIKLSAEHRGGRIIIELSDDGRGINRKRVREKAISSNLIDADAILSDEEIDNLIFLPGFSTATEVSDLSGRGVGMDVVRRNVEATGGRVAIRSVPGKGSTFRMTLPLTLAVMEGMVVAVGAETYILPLANIVECIRVRPADIQLAAMGGQFLVLRGEVIPLIYLCRFFNVANAKTGDKAHEGVVMVIEVEGGAKAGLVVDEIRGQQQVVVKSLEANYGRIDGAAAATVMGDGQVALIVDVDAFARLVSVGRGAGTRAAQ